LRSLAGLVAGLRRGRKPGNPWPATLSTCSSRGYVWGCRPSGMAYHQLIGRRCCSEWAARHDARSWNHRRGGLGVLMSSSGWPGHPLFTRRRPLACAVRSPLIRPPLPKRCAAGGPRGAPAIEGAQAAPGEWGSGSSTSCGKSDQGRSRRLQIAPRSSSCSRWGAGAASTKIASTGANRAPVDGRGEGPPVSWCECAPYLVGRGLAFRASLVLAARGRFGGGARWRRTSSWFMPRAYVGPLPGLHFIPRRVVIGGQDSFGRVSRQSSHRPGRPF